VDWHAADPFFGGRVASAFFGCSRVGMEPIYAVFVVSVQSSMAVTVVVVVLCRLLVLSNGRFFILSLNRHGADPFLIVNGSKPIDYLSPRRPRLHCR